MFGGLFTGSPDNTAAPSATPAFTGLFNADNAKAGAVQVGKNVEQQQLTKQLQPKIVQPKQSAMARFFNPIEQGAKSLVNSTKQLAQFPIGAVKQGAAAITGNKTAFKNAAPAERQGINTAVQAIQSVPQAAVRISKSVSQIPGVSTVAKTAGKVAETVDPALANQVKIAKDVVNSKIGDQIKHIELGKNTNVPSYQDIFRQAPGGTAGKVGAVTTAAAGDALSLLGAKGAIRGAGDVVSPGEAPAELTPNSETNPNIAPKPAINTKTAFPTTSKVIGNLSRSKDNTENATPARGSSTAVTTKPSAPAEPPQINALADNTKPTGSTPTPAPTAKLPDTQPLLDHAYKFKTAEGFVKNPTTQTILDKISNPDTLAKNKLTAHGEVLDRMGVSSLEDLHAKSQEPRLVSTKPDEAKPFNPTSATPPIKTSALASGVEANAVKANLTSGFKDLPEYATVNVKDQATAAINLLKSDPARAIRIAHGLEKPPEGLLPESVFTAVENGALKTKNVDLLHSLATNSSLTTEATGMGQRIRMLAERNQLSPVSVMKQITDARKAAFEKNNKGSMDANIKSTVKDIKGNITPPSKYDWSNFVESLKC